MLYLTNIDLNQNELQNAILQPLAVAPATPKLGQIYCNSATSKIMWYTGTEWRTIGVVVESSATNGSIIVDGVEMTVYSLPIASDTQLGGIKVGTGLVINAQGVLSTNLAAPTWGDIQGKPTAISEFTNDENFIDNTVNNLVNYYKKSETYTQTEVNTLIGQLATIQISAVSTLPATGSSNIIYLVPKAGGTSPNAKDEYLWTGTAFEKIGDTEIDLSNYLQKNGDGSNVTAAFTLTDSKVLPTTGESISIIIGKITRYLSDLESVAFSGSYQDLVQKPILMKYLTYNIENTETTNSQHITGSAIYSVTVTDSVTNDIVMCDVDIAGTVVTVSVSENPTNALKVSVLYV